MNNYLINSNETANVILQSRNIYEAEQSLGNNSTTYGKIANIIAYNSQYIDTIAEYLGNYASSTYILNTLYDQYHDDEHQMESFVNRNLYVDNLKSKKMTNERFFKGMTIDIGIQAIIKLGSRALYKALSEKEKITIFQEIDSLLRYYTFSNLNDSICFENRAKLELKKIEQTFPLNKNQIQKLNNSIIENNIDQLKLNTLFNLDENLKESISYLIYSIHMQKYGINTNYDNEIWEVYSLLGYNHNLSKELLRENNEIYNEMINDQIKFLKISRSIFKDVAMELPNLDITQITNRTIKMATFDPYIERRKKTSKMGKGVGITLAGLLLKDPSLVMQGCSTGLSMLNINAETSEHIRNKLLRNNFDNKTIDNIITKSQIIQDNSINESKY